MADTIDPSTVERLKIQQIIADFDQKRADEVNKRSQLDVYLASIDQMRADAELKRKRQSLEDRRYFLQLIATVGGAMASGAALMALILRH